jgi:hypothetical protein
MKCAKVKELDGVRRHRSLLKELSRLAADITEEELF